MSLLIRYIKARYRIALLIRNSRHDQQSNNYYRWSWRSSWGGHMRFSTSIREVLIIINDANSWKSNNLIWSRIGTMIIEWHGFRSTFNAGSHGVERYDIRNDDQSTRSMFLKPINRILPWRLGWHNIGQRYAREQMKDKDGIASESNSQLGRQYLIDRWCW